MLRSETAGDSQRMDRALRGLRLYQEAERQPPMPSPPPVAEVHGATLRDYGGEGRDLLVIPSLINPPNILDLGAQTSLLRWLAGRGHRVLLLDWGNDAKGRADLSVADHVEQIILPLIHGLNTPPAIVGYCLGGTMAVAAAALVRVPKLVTIAAPWRFSGYTPDARARLANLWAGAQQTATSLGLLPMEVLQASFWSLDPHRTISKFEAFADLDRVGGEARAFVTLEDWANDGPPLPLAAAREMFEAFFAEDCTGTGRWRVGSQTIDPAHITCPQLHITSATDRIVPQASAISAGEQRLLQSGHVGMIVGSKARRLLWEPLDGWLSHPSR